MTTQWRAVICMAGLFAVLQDHELGLMPESDGMAKKGVSHPLGGNAAFPRGVFFSE